jgi:hypothetical protein
VGGPPNSSDVVARFPRSTEGEHAWPVQVGDDSESVPSEPGLANIASIRFVYFRCAVVDRAERPGHGHPSRSPPVSPDHATAG